jgi:hypothetical protein
MSGLTVLGVCPPELWRRWAAFSFLSSARAAILAASTVAKPPFRLRTVFSGE